MNSNLVVFLTLALSETLLCHPVAAQSPDRIAPPAAKDAYVAAQLSKLFGGAPGHVHVTLRGAFYRWLDVEISAPQASAASTNTPATMPNVNLFAFDNKAAARDEVRQELTSFKQPKALTKAGYDEFYSGMDGEMIGQRGTVVVSLDSGQPEQFDAVFGALATNLSANPALLPDLVHYAYTMHFGDPAPLHAVLSKLSEKVPELSAANFSSNQLWGENSVAVDCTDSSGNKLTIIAKAYDSEAAARAGLTRDQSTKQVGWNKTQLVQGVTIYEYTSRVDFQADQYTFELSGYGGKVDTWQMAFAARPQAVLDEVQGRTNASSRHASSLHTSSSSATKPEDALAMLLKVSPALIADLAPPAK